MLYVKEIIRPKYALKDSTQLPPGGQKGVEMAPCRSMPVDKCIADTSLLAEILLQKYEYHVPFYRQIQQYRHLGMKGLTESTLDGWFKKTVELLKPLYEELKWEVFSCDYVQADETTVPVINREKTQSRQGISLDGKISHGETGHLPLRRGITGRSGHRIPGKSI